MIRHVPEGIVPFENCGYGRAPIYPFIGQEISLDCLCDNETTPVLEFDNNQVDPPVVSEKDIGDLRSLHSQQHNHCNIVLYVNKNILLGFL